MIDIRHWCKVLLKHVKSFLQVSILSEESSEWFGTLSSLCPRGQHRGLLARDDLVLLSSETKRSYKTTSNRLFHRLWLHRIPSWPTVGSCRRPGIRYCPYILQLIFLLPWGELLEEQSEDVVPYLSKTLGLGLGLCVAVYNNLTKLLVPELDVPRMATCRTQPNIEDLPSHFLKSLRVYFKFDIHDLSYHSQMSMVSLLYSH